MVEYCHFLGNKEKSRKRLFYANNKINEVSIHILIMILKELTAAGTGLLEPILVLNTGATPDTGANIPKIIIFLLLFDQRFGSFTWHNYLSSFFAPYLERPCLRPCTP